MITVYKVVVAYDNETFVSQYAPPPHELLYQPGSTLVSPTPIFVYQEKPAYVRCGDAILECTTPAVYRFTASYDSILAFPYELDQLTPQQLQDFWIEGWVSDRRDHTMSRKKSPGRQLSLQYAHHHYRCCFELNVGRRIG